MRKIFTLFILLLLLPVTALAATVENITYLNENGTQQTAASATQVTNSDTQWTNGWYVAQGDITIDQPVTVSDNVYLILEDGCNLTVNGGILLKSGSNMYIYAQSTKKETMGSLTATGTDAGIKEANYGTPTLTIAGGKITAIGSNIGISAGSLTITDGYVSASGNGYSGKSIAVMTTTISGGFVDLHGDFIGTLSTGTDGHAVISSTGEINKIAENCKGLFLIQNEGKIYGDTFTLTQDLNIAASNIRVTVGEGQTLTLDNGVTLTIPQYATLTNNGILNNNGSIINTGTLNNIGTLNNNGTLNNTSVLNNAGSIINNGTLTGEVGGSGTVTPKITTDSLSDGTVGESYTAKLQATGNNITWSSSGMPEWMTLGSSTGVISGIPTTADTYTFTVTATNESGSDSKVYTLTIQSVPVTGVTLDQTELDLFTGASATLTATVKPSDATDKTVTWSSDNEAVATVDENGKVTAVGEGEATITVTTTDGSKTATCQVTVLHSNLKYFERKEASCTEPGNIEYWYCEGCNKYFSDEAGTTEIKLEDVAIPATGHHYVNGYCTKCGHRDPDYRPDPISYYNIYVEDVCDGVEVIPSKRVVREGGSITVYVEKDTANYTFDNFKVYYKRSYYGTWEELKEGVQPGEYPVHNIWTHIYIKAEGAEEKEDPTGIESIEGVKVYTKDGSLYVQTPQREQVIIVSMSGAVVKNEEQIGLKQYHGLQPGIYIVRVGDRTYKLRLN